MWYNMPVNLKGEIEVGGKNSKGVKAMKKTMPRLKGFNYRRPFFYMVTLKRRAGEECAACNLSPIGV